MSDHQERGRSGTRRQRCPTLARAACSRASTPTLATSVPHRHTGQGTPACPAVAGARAALAPVPASRKGAPREARRPGSTGSPPTYAPAFVNGLAHGAQQPILLRSSRGCAQRPLGDGRRTTAGWRKDVGCVRAAAATQVRDGRTRRRRIVAGSEASRLAVGRATRTPLRVPGPPPCLALAEVPHLPGRGGKVRGDLAQDEPAPTTEGRRRRLGRVRLRPAPGRRRDAPPCARGPGPHARARRRPGRGRR